MSILALILVGAIAATPIEATTLTCNLALPDGTNFRLEGQFDDEGLRSNLSELAENGSLLAPGVPIVITDGTNHRYWSVPSEERTTLEATLTEYGSAAAVMTVIRRTFVGRHNVRSLVGVGLCDVRRQVSNESEI